MPSPIYIDTETCGLHGVPVLIQWAEGDGDVQLFSPWTNPIRDTLRLIEKFANHPDGLVFFNAAFDWFHICKIYTMFILYHDHDEIPENIIDVLAELEMTARDGPCLKPVKACDVMLVARKGPYQSTMDRGDIRIRRVPTALAWQLADELERRIKLKDIYFARRKNKHAAKWNIYDIVDSEGDVDVNFKDIVLKFAPSAALKALAVDALGIDMTEILLFGDVEVDEHWYPVELGYAPFAKAIGTRHDWKGAWPEKIRHHIGHWNYHETARRYAADDVKYTRALYYKFGSPALGDNDSELACMVAAVRWRGFKLDLAKLQELRAEAAKRFVKIPTAPAQVRYYITQHLDETEKLVLRGSTKKIVLEEIAKWLRPCPTCNAKANIEFAEGMTMDEDEVPTISMETQITVADKCKDCLVCEGKGTLPHLAAIRAQEVLDARASTKEVEIFDKLIHAGRFHASFKVIGALSSRMSGTDGLNAQGIKKTKEVRSCFPLAWDDMILCGGDFAGFEVTIAVAVYDDENLRKMLLTCEQCGGAASFDREKNDFICEKCSGNKQKKIHALFGLHCFPEHTYESLKATSGTKDDKYTRAKSGVFALMYGGTEFTLADRLGVPVEIGLKALASFHREFPGVRRFQQDIFNSFCVTADTWIMTDIGPRQVHELKRPFTAIVDSFPYRASGFWETGCKRVYEVTTKHGYKIRATEEHPLFVNYFANRPRKDEGQFLWQPIKNILPGNMIRLGRQINVNWEGQGNWKEGYLLGWLFGDGSIASHGHDNRLYFYKNDLPILHHVCTLFHIHPQVQYIEASDCYYVKSEQLDNLIAEYGIVTEKRITEHLEQCSSEFLSGFLSAFFDADGSARSDVKQVDLHQSNKEILQVVQRILLRFGIVSHLNKVANAGKSVIQGRNVEVKDAWRLAIYKDNVIVFQSRIGFKHPTKSSAIEAAIAKCNKNKMYKEYFVSEVVSIDYIGEQVVFDVTVDNAHCFDANGILAHNCSMRQPNGLGSKVEWHEPADYRETMFGFRRYFTLENQICHALFTLANKPPASWRDVKIKVLRRDRIQSASGAVQSSLYGAAFQIQAGNMRAAANHDIQSAGATITKAVQRRVWDLQPSGIGEWLVQPMNIHDEILAPCKPHMTALVKKTVNNAVEEFREKIPLIKMDWVVGLKSWAEKG